MHTSMSMHIKCTDDHWDSIGPDGDGKFSTPIEVIVPHENELVTVSFGSTVREHKAVYLYNYGRQI